MLERVVYVHAHYLYISLVGTSIIKNAVQRIGERWVEKYSDIEVWHNMSLGDPRNAYPDGQLCRLRMVEPELYEDLLSVAVSLGEKASAEVSGLVGLTKVCGHGRGEVEVVLYPTASCTSALSAELNRAALLELGFGKVEIEVLEKLGKFETFEEGLVELLDKVVARTAGAKEKGIRVFLNATPGFKAESSFLVIASLLAGASGVVYVHETFQEPVFIPAIPVRVDEEFAKLVKVLGDKIPLEAWSSIELEKRLELKERGIVRQAGGCYEVRPWIRVLVEKLGRAQSQL